MLLDNKYTIIPLIKLTLKYEDEVVQTVIIKAGDEIDCTYKKNGEICLISGLVNKIGCNFNSSLGAVGTTVYIQIDGSTLYRGRVEYIQPQQILNVKIRKSTIDVVNPVCSVDNPDQKVALVRENEAGVFQYSIDGITWETVTGAQGPSAYQSALNQGFVGTEKEWLESLKGEAGDPSKFVLKAPITVSQDVGGYHVGDVITEGTAIVDIIRQILAPGSGANVYVGVSYSIPTNLQGLTAKDVSESELLQNGYTYKYTSNDERFVFAYKKTFGLLKSIKDINGFENIDGWSYKEYQDYYIYYTNETLTVDEFQIKFIFNND